MTTKSPAGGGGGASGAGAPRPCNEADLCKWLEKFVHDKNGSDKPKVPANTPVNPNSAHWLNDLYAAYWDLYKAVTRLEKKEYGLPFDPKDSIIKPPGGTDSNKAGCPPPPGFPA